MRLKARFRKTFRKTFCPTLGSKGFSVVETIFALAVIGVTFGGYAYFVHLSKASKRQSTLTNCTNAARGVLDTLRALGYETKMAQTSLTQNKVNPDTTGVVKEAHLFPEPNGPDLYKTAPGGKVELHNYRTILGSMSALAAIYNSKTEYCSTGAVYHNAGNALLARLNGPKGVLEVVDTKIRVERYNLNDASVDCPSRPIYFRPRGDTSPPPAKKLGIVETPGNVMSEDHGFKVTAILPECSASAIFQYPRGPAPVDLNAVNPQPFQQNTVAVCQASDSGSLVFELPTDYDKKGMVPMCQDQSNPTMAGGDCSDGPKGTNFSVSYTWVPCHTVTWCGRPPSNSQLVGTTLTNSYTGVPWGCNGKVNVRMVDPQLNTTYQLPFPEVNFNNGVPSCNGCPSGIGKYCNKDTMSTECSGTGGDGGDGGDGKGGDGNDSDGNPSDGSGTPDGKDGGAW